MQRLRVRPTWSPPGAAAMQFARAKWGDREGVFAAVFASFFLTFGVPSAVIPLASDMLLFLPHMVAIYFAWRGRAFWSGVAAGTGLLCSSKAVFVLAACALWQWRQVPLLALGFLAPTAIALGWMALQGSVAQYYLQVWQWGGMYASDTFVSNPLGEGLKRTLNWAGFQAALAVGAAIAWVRDREWRLWIWAGLSLVGVVPGLRFFPRYYFLLLPPMTIAAARGWALLVPRNRLLTAAALLVLLGVPFVRFGSPYLILARGGTLSDLNTDRDSREVSARLREQARAGDTLFVWGFRPDIFIDSGLPAGTRFLESQPISGVLADRHLFSSVPSGAAFTPRNRAELVGTHPTWVVDGLGLYNPALSLSRQSELAAWFDPIRRGRVVPVSRFSTSCDKSCGKWWGGPPGPRRTPSSGYGRRRQVPTRRRCG